MMAMGWPLSGNKFEGGTEFDEIGLGSDIGMIAFVTSASASARAGRWPPT